MFAVFQTGGKQFRAEPGAVLQVPSLDAEPVLRPLRQVLSPGNVGGIDISPILAIVIIQIAKYVVIQLAYR